MAINKGDYIIVMLLGKRYKDKKTKIKNDVTSSEITVARDANSIGRGLITKILSKSNRTALV